MKEIKLPGNDLAAVDDYLEHEQEAFLAPDPASIVISAFIIQRVRDSVSDFRALFTALNPELEVVFDQVLVSLSDAKVIRVIGDRIFVLRSNPMFKLKGTSLRQVTNKLIGTVADRLMANMETNSVKAGDELCWQCLPDHPKVRRRLHELNNRYADELIAIQKSVSDDPSIQADGVIINVNICGSLLPEEY